MAEKQQAATLSGTTKEDTYHDLENVRGSRDNQPSRFSSWLPSSASSPRWWHRASSPPSIPSSTLPVSSDGDRQPRWQTPSGRRLFRLQDFRERVLLVLLALSTWWFFLAPSGSTPSDPIDALLRDVPLIDTHIDFPIFLRAFYHNRINNLTREDSLKGQVDFPRLREGKLGAVFWSAYVPCPPEDDRQKDGHFPDELYTDSVAWTYDQLDLIHRLIRQFGDDLSLTTTSSSIFHNHQFPPPYRTIGSLAGGEGLHSIGNRASNLRMFHSLGMRYMTLTHNCHNAYADAAISSLPPVHGGLSAKGRALLLEMNRIGMMIDLSHVSADTMRDALNVSEAPVIFSHSGARSVNDHVRNVPDDVLDQLPAKDGVVQVTFLPEFVSKNPDDADLAAVADHIVYIGERIGYEHVGIGSDYDGMPAGARGLEDVSKYPALLRELADRGLSYQQLAGVAGKNLLRVMQRVEYVAALSTRLPLEDEAGFEFNASVAVPGARV